MRDFPREADAEFRGFLSATPRALVLFRGDHCPYSATFRPHFEAAEARLPAWAFATRELSERDDAPWDAHDVRVTPTVVAYLDGREAARLEGKGLLGVTRTAFARWLRTLP